MLKLVCVFLALVTPLLCQTVFQKACQYIVDDSALYNLFEFTNVPQKQLTVTDLHDSSREKQFIFHLCTRQVPACDVSSDQSTLFKNLVFGKLEYKNDKSAAVCKNVTTPNDDRQTIPTYLDEENSSKGIKLTFPQTSSGGTKFTLVVELTCDPKVSASNITWTTSFTESLDDFNNGNQIIVIQGAGKNGCPVITLEGILSFFKRFKIFFTLIYIIVGFGILTFGFKYFNVSIFIMSASITTAIVFIFISMVFIVEASTKTRWIYFGVSLAIGFLVGYFIVKVKKVGFFSLGVHFGIIGSFFLYSFLLHFFNLSQSALILCMIVMAVLGGLLAIWLWKDIIIIATSFVGAYLIVRALSFYFGGFPNELQVISGLVKYDYRAYAYLIIMIFVAIYGVVRQYQKKSKDEEEEEDSYQEASISQF